MRIPPFEPILFESSHTRGPRRTLAGLRTITVLLGAAALAACAASQGPASAAAARPQVVCVNERSTGSLVPKRVCRTAAEIEAERAAARKAMDTIRSAPNLPTGSH